MNADDAKDQIKRIATVYPSLREFLARTASDAGDSAKTVDHWCAMLSECDAADVTDIVDDIVAGRREPYSRFQKPDQLPWNIRAEAMARRLEREEKKQQDERYHQPVQRAKANPNRRKATPMVKSLNGLLQNWYAGNIAAWLGDQVRQGKITQEENDRRLDELFAWDRGDRDRLDWLPQHSQPRQERA